MQKKLSKIERLVKGAFEIGKYTSYLTVLSSLGCVHYPNVFSTSKDGRYVATMVDHEGKFTVHNHPKNPDNPEYPLYHIVLIDTQTNEVDLIGTEYNLNDFLCITNTRKKVAFMAGDPYDSDGAQVKIFSKTENRTIKNAGFPVLFPDGNRIVYSKVVGRYNNNSPKLDLTIINLDTGLEKRLGIEALASDVSPDQNYLAMITMETVSRPDNAEDDTTLYLEICDINGRSRRRISQLELDCFDFPKWRDNDFIYFKTTPPGEKDAEIFATNKNGRIWRITDNDIDELNVHVFPDGRLYYAEKRSDQEDSENSPIKFMLGRGHNPVNIGIDTNTFYAIANNKVVYLDREGNLLMKLIGSHTSVNLSRRINEKYAGLLPLSVTIGGSYIPAPTKSGIAPIPLGLEEDVEQALDAPKVPEPPSIDDE